MKRKNFGFTLIELLVVIVIIGILATISTATFKQYFGKARDAARNTSVANITLMMKVDGADRWDNDKYIYSAVELDALFGANDYRPPKGENNICYVVSMARGADVVGDDNEFMVSTWGEETSTKDNTAGGPIVDGTTQGLTNVIELATLVQADFACTNAAGTLSDVNAAFIAAGGAAPRAEIQNPADYVWIDGDGEVQAFDYVP